jgi:5-methylcytosine-specific restriction protein A
MTDVPTTPRKPMGTMRRLRIFEEHGGICVICTLKIKVGERWIIEHKRALALGGADTDDNCGPAHETCRREKDKTDNAAWTKAKRMKARHLGIKKASRPILGSIRSGWKKPFNRPAERRT